MLYIVTCIKQTKIRKKEKKTNQASHLLSAISLWMKYRKEELCSNQYTYFSGLPLMQALIDFC